MEWLRACLAAAAAAGGGGLSGGIPPPLATVAPEEELAVGAGAGAVVLGLVLAAVGSVGAHAAAPAAIPVGVVQPVHALHAHVRIEQVVAGAAAAAAGEAPASGLHLGRRRRRWQRLEVPVGDDVAAGPAVRLARWQASQRLRAPRRRAVVHAHVGVQRVGACPRGRGRRQSRTLLLVLRRSHGRLDVVVVHQPVPVRGVHVESRRPRAHKLRVGAVEWRGRWLPIGFVSRGVSTRFEGWCRWYLIVFPGFRSAPAAAASSSVCSPNVLPDRIARTFG